MVLFEKGPEFFLKFLFLMMLLLIFDIINNYINFSRINREYTVSVLPVELSILPSFGFYPFGRLFLYFFKQLHLGNFS